MEFFEAKVTKIVQENSDTYSYYMEVPQGYTWKAGQHAVFAFRDLEVAEGEKADRIFTIASAPQEETLMFTTRIAEQHSAYKDVLLRQVEVGTVMKVGQALGRFDFKMEEYGKSLVIAGGIGITPIRALLQHYAGSHLDHVLTVLYSDDRGEFAYGDFWQQMQQKMPNLELHLISERDEFTLFVSGYAAQAGNEAQYLISGSPGMNNAFSQSLQAQGIEKANIAMDSFMGL